MLPVLAKHSKILPMCLADLRCRCCPAGHDHPQLDSGRLYNHCEISPASIALPWTASVAANRGHPLHERINRLIAMVRARVEHPTRVIKRQFGHVKSRYRGLAKNRDQLFTLLALGNLFLVRRRLIA